MQTAIEVTHRPFTMDDLCDKCGAQAKVRATLANGELYFCGHHARSAGNNLVHQSLVVFDPENKFGCGRG